MMIYDPGPGKKDDGLMAKGTSLTKITVGCQAWGYDDWKTLRGGPTVFFPPGIKPHEKLSFYAKIFDTVEVDSSFYAMPRISDIENWSRQVPEHFTFSFKMPRDVTHGDNLGSASHGLAKEFIGRLAVLKNKLGAVLIQLPRAFKMTAANAANLANFLEFLPGEIRFAVELRSPEWFVPEIFELLAGHNAALCLGQNEFLLREIIMKAREFPSADLAYFRFSGARDLTKLDRIQRPQEESINFWAEQIKTIKSKTTFVYFSNLFEGFSPESAAKFRKLIGQTPVAPEQLNPAPSLF
jgi:uncharacterized protein YecE (DUF72 family)